MQHYSDSGQDLVVIRKLGKSGFFVDVGAGEINGSNTMLLEEIGWSGLCIEPHPRNSEIIRTNRSCLLDTSIVASIEEEVDFVIQERDVVEGVRHHASYGGSGIIKHMAKDHLNNHVIRLLGGRIVTVRTRKLENILDQYSCPNVIDFLDIDVEGAQLDVIKDFPFNRYKFKIINIEVGECRADIDKLLCSNNYKVMKEFGFDVMYINKEFV